MWLLKGEKPVWAQLDLLLRVSQAVIKRACSLRGQSKFGVTNFISFLRKPVRSSLCLSPLLSFRQRRPPEYIPGSNRGWTPVLFNVKKSCDSDFPGSPVVKAQCFQFGGHRFDAWLGRTAWPKIL